MNASDIREQAKINEVIAEKSWDAAENGYYAAEDAAVKGYKAVENAVVGGYKAVENAVTGAYEKVENAFVDTFFAKEGESTEEAKARLSAKAAEHKEA